VEGEEPPHSTGRITCPRCGQPVSYIEKHRRNGHVYYYAVHYLGYERAPDGRVRKRLRKCYLGPEAYTEVSRTHGDLELYSFVKRLTAFTHKSCNGASHQ